MAAQGQTRRSTKWRMLLAVAPFLCAGAYLLGTQAGSPIRTRVGELRSSVSGLSIDQSSLDLGELWEEPLSFKHQMRIRNDTARSITIDDFDSSCNCLGISPRTGDILPNEEMVVTLELETDHRGVRDMHLAQHEMTFSFRPVIRGSPTGPESWKVTARVNRRLCLDAMALNFGELTNSDDPTRMLHAIVHVPAQAIRAKMEPPICEVSVQPGVTSLRETNISIAPTKDLPKGTFAGTLYIDVVSPTGEALHGAKISVEGNNQRGFRLLPVYVMLPATRVDQEVLADITLQAPRDEMAIVDRWEADSTDATITKLEGPDLTGLQVFRVKYRVRKPGEQVIRVHCAIRGKNLPAEKLTTVLVVHGVRPQPGTNGH